MTSSTLSPRDIQARIRGGATLDEVAAEAGVPSAQIEPFAGPVLAERQHLAGSALASPVRRRGESSSQRSLRQVAREHLQARGVDIDDLEWDAYRDDDRHWHVTGSYLSQEQPGEHVAEFLFDQRARFCTAANDEARFLIGEATQQQRVSATRPDPDSEPTVDLNDEMAIVRAVHEDEPARPGTGSGVNVRHESITAFRERLRTPAVEGERGSNAEADAPDYSEAELEAVDGVYDIVPPTSDMDVLYEMLSSFNEDSVNIYAGLSRPVTHDEQQPTGEAVGNDEDAAEVTSDAFDVTDVVDVDVEADVPTTDSDVSHVVVAEIVETDIVAVQVKEPPAEAGAHGSTGPAVEDVLDDLDDDEWIYEVGDEADEPTRRIPRRGAAAPSDEAAAVVPPSSAAATEASASQQAAPGASAPVLAAPQSTAAGQAHEAAAHEPAESRESADWSRWTTEAPAIPDDASTEAADGPGQKDDEPVHTGAARAEPEDAPAPPSENRAAGSVPGRASRAATDEPQQDTLLDEPAERPKPKPRPRRKGRAQVPSWDEIMFGGPGKES